MTELEDLWYGNVIPHEQFLDGNAAYRKLLSRTVKRRDELVALLAEEQKEKLTALDTANAELNALAEQSAFSFGFKLGVKMMCEVIYHTE
ncbi:MAG: hypothetical protein IJS45_05635 [Clostridia bacterium]|nr:hypothetical protein [Clostridia bacterium]